MRLVVDLGARCNNRCVSCGLGDWRASDESPADSVVHERLATGAAGAMVVFAGGEPTLHEALPGWIAAARAAGARTVALQTNGRRLAYAAYARALAAAGLAEVEIALYGAQAASHDYHTRVPGSFEQSCAAIRTARAAGLRVGVSLLATRSSWRELPEAAALALRLGASRLRVSMTRARGDAASAFDRVVPRVTLAGEAAAEVARLARAERVPVVLDGFPACVLADAADAALAPAPPPAWPGVHAAACERCSWRPGCPGLDADYAARAGTAELRPRADAPRPPVAATVAAAASFVGLWRAQPPAPAPSRPPRADPSLVAIGPAPGKREQREAGRRVTGEELRSIFPSLWGDGEPPSGKPE